MAVYEVEWGGVVGWYCVRGEVSLPCYDCDYDVVAWWWLWQDSGGGVLRVTYLVGVGAVMVQ